MVTSQYERSVFFCTGQKTTEKRQKEKQTEGQSITWYMYMVPINLNICDRFFVISFQNVNISLMYRLAEDFYVSLGMEPMTQEFWEKSMFVRPSTQPVECGPSTWDFGDGKDYR